MARELHDKTQNEHVNESVNNKKNKTTPSKGNNNRIKLTSHMHDLSNQQSSTNDSNGANEEPCTVHFEDEE
jgi:hypothetical protein